MQHWIFDLDGTLVNSFPFYTQVVTEVLQDFGISLSSEQQAQAKHHIPKVYLAKFLNEDQVDQAFEKIIQISLQRQSEVPLYEGIRDLLVFLKSKNCTLSVFTAREKTTALALLETTGLRQHFSHVVTRDCVTNSKPHPEGLQHILKESNSLPEKAIMIGDHRMDMESARSAGVPCISVN